MEKAMQDPQGMDPGMMAVLPTPSSSSSLLLSAWS